MSMALRIVIDVLLGISAVFALGGVLGMLRMPDVFNRMQTSTIISVFWLLGLMIAGILVAVFALHNGAAAVKVALIGLFFVLTAPVVGHALSRAAYLNGERPYTPLKPNKYGDDKPYDKGGVV
ncbi:MAG: monovalent cation/H(+) antiporter subunit G [Firmicutes bacterium]|nr:monovalent cation/H(+) antiporter subunit G [Bacillota bacterium]